MTRHLKAGHILKKGEIEIIDLVGSGGIGEVYRASMLRDGEHQLVAVKCFNAEKLQQFNVESIEMVHRESLAISRIQHSSIVRIYGIELDGVLPYIIEEFLGGGDLGKSIAARKQHKNSGELIFSALELATIGHQICEGLMLLHQENQYHGDLKPNNLCFRDKDQSQIVIVDFGHGGFLEGNLLNRNENLATLAYLPPERTGFVKMAGNANSDLYSLGVTLYETATGLVPFSANDSREMVNRLLFEVPKPLHELFPGFPLALSDIISKLLRKNPQDRYHSAFGLAADLERCLQALRSGEELTDFALGSKDKLRELNYRIPMVGRDQEIARLHSLFDITLAGGASVALIGAPSGTGKSRLAFELLHRAREKQCFISYVKFSEYERNLPLSAVTLLLAEHAHYLKTCTVSQLHRWQDTIMLKLGAKGRLIAERFPFYEGLLPSFPRQAMSDSSADFQAFNVCLGEFIAMLSVNGEAQLVLIDDLQWADWQSLQVLGVVADAILAKQNRKIMFMGTYRSNEVNLGHPLNDSLLDRCPESSLIELGSLDRAASDLLIESLLGEQGPEISKLQNITYKFTAGNPFYIYEYLKSSIQNGIFALKDTSKTWHFHEERIHQANLSSGVAGLVADRIRSLSPIDQALIALASLSGLAMNRDNLTELLPVLLSLRGIDQGLPELQDIPQTIELAYQVLRQKNLLIPDENRFRFFHDKIQEAAYSLLTENERTVLHPAYGLCCVRDLRASQEKTHEAQIFDAAYHICKGDRQQLQAYARSFLLEAAKAALKIFAYAKAKEFLQANIEALNAQPGIALEERFENLVVLADALSISDQINEAMKLYDTLLEFDCTPLQRAEIYSKKCEFAMNLFEYKQARDASANGLKALGVRIMTRQLTSYLYILIFFPILVIYAGYFKYFGRQTKEVSSEAEKIRFQLLLKNEISQYFTVPIAAIANIIKLNFELMSYKDSDFRATLFCYWGCCVSSFGFTKVGGKFFARAYEYFDRTANPVDKGFVLFCWGLLSDMTSGNIPAAHKKLDEAVRTLAPIGESFWRSITLVGLILVDYYGGETDEAGMRSHDLIELWKKVRFAATPLGTTIRHFMEEERKDQMDFILDQTVQAEQALRNQGFESIDSIFALLSVGEYYELHGKYAVADDFLRRATWMGVRYVHRMSYASYAPIVYSRSLIQQSLWFRAILPLTICWFNQLLNVRLFMPQTLFVSGLWLDCLGLKLLGRMCIEQGIEYASKRHWATIVAEGRLLLGKVIVNQKPALALVYLHLAKDYFQQRNWIFHSSLCDEQLKLQKIVLWQGETAEADSRGNTTQSTKQGAGLRQQIEIKSLLEVLLKLSAISNREELFKALMEALCQVTGSELALIMMREGEKWVPITGLNISIQSGELLSSRVDRRFIDSSIQAELRVPSIRMRMDGADGQQSARGSAMIVPMVYESRIFGYCYLGNTQIYEIYDAQSIEIAGPIATQGAIALQNIILNEELAVERDQLSELHHTLEHRVIEQTRDIKSIMQHIKMGICTVSGSGISINKDYSKFLESLLGESDLHEKALLPLLLSHSQLSEDERDQAKSALTASLSETDFAFIANEHILPRYLSKENEGHLPYALELDWIPIVNESYTVERVLLTINDVTALRGLEEQATQKDHDLRIITEILASSTREWQLFVSSAVKLTEQNGLFFEELHSGLDAESLIRKIFINMHTIKGNARALGCKLMNESIHNIEHYFSELIRNSESPMDFATIESKIVEVEKIVQRYKEIGEVKLGRGTQSSQTVRLSRDALLGFYKKLMELADLGMISTHSIAKPILEIREALFVSVDSIFQQLFSGIENVAIDLKKPMPLIKLDMPKLWVTEQGEEILRNSFVHILRNSLDHGIEAAEERLILGKNPTGLIELSCQQRGSCIEFRMADDGRGLNLKKLADMGVQRGLITLAEAEDESKVAALVFRTDFSTAEVVNDLSGRGVGMAAVAQYIQAAGGWAEIEFLDGRSSAAGYRAFALLVALPMGLFQAETADQIAA